MHKPLLLLLLGLPLSACAPSAAPAPITMQRRPAIDSLPITTPWSDFAPSIQARLRLSNDHLMETDPLQATLEFRNISDHPVDLILPISGSALRWSLEEQPLPTPPVNPKEPAQRLHLAPQDSFIAQPITLWIPSVQNAHLLRAQIATTSTPLTLTAPLTISPAIWGPSADGLRMRLSGQQDIPSGEPFIPRLFIHNQRPESRSLHLPAWLSRSIAYRNDLITLTYRTDDDHAAVLDPAALWQSPLDPEQPLLLAPGRYRLRVILESPELPASSGPAWHGRLVTNDLPVDVK